MTTMAQTTVTFKTDSNTKEIAQIICKKLGINMTTAINMFLHQMIIHNGIPFEVVLHPNEETKKAIKEAESDEESKLYDSWKDLMKDLDTED